MLTKLRGVVKLLKKIMPKKLLYWLEGHRVGLAVTWGQL